MTRDLFWAAVFTLLGFAILATVPFENPLPFLIAGWAGLTAAATFWCRVALRAMDGASW